MKETPLTQGYVALVDDEDYERVAQFTWHAGIDRRAVYAQRSIARTTVQLHRLVLEITDAALQVDHRDHNGLNCQKQNLRVCTNSQNQGNKRKSTRSTSSKYKGVSWHKQRGKWQATITRLNKFSFLGYFSSEEDAARAYDRAARDHFGGFAHRNFRD